MGNFFVAEQTYNDILKAFPHEPECYYGIGLVNFYKQEFLKAKEQYEIASKIITPLIKITEQQIKNRYYKINNNTGHVIVILIQY